MPSLVHKLRSPVVIAVILLSAHALLLAYAAAENSATFDEPAHLAAGAEYWRQGDFTIYSLSPPLLRLWAAIPAVLAGAHAPATDSVRDLAIVGRHWEYADMFVYANPGRFPLLLMLARWGMIPISCFAGWVTYRWAASLYGPASGAAACAMYCLNPSILADGSLMTTDLGTAAAILAAAWLWWRFCRRPSRGQWMLVLLAIVAVHLCKFTAVLLWPMLLAMAVPFVFSGPRKGWWKIFASWVGLGAATLLIVNALYGFSGTGQKLSSFNLMSDFMQSARRRLPAGFPSPLPRLIVEGIDAQKMDTEAGYSGFLFGETYIGSRWYYYPVALLCKLPISMLLLAAAALASTLVKRRSPAKRMEEWSVCLAGAVFVFGVQWLGDVNIGTRYLLPAFPLAMILISRIWSMDRPVPERETPQILPEPADPHKSKTARRNAAITSRRAVIPYVRDGLLALLAIEILWVCPYFLSFVNFAVGGPSNGWRLLTDSDFDWGQGLIALRHWTDNHKDGRTALLYFGFIDPAAYGVLCDPIVRAGNDPYIAVSSYYLDGLHNRIVVSPHHHLFIALAFYKQLQNKKPIAVVADTIFIYSRHDVEQAIMQAQSAPPETPPR